MPLPAISLSQFNRIATGKYNAGFVDFQTDDHGNLTGELAKVNNHVHATGKNKAELSPARVLEVKEAFIAAMERAMVPEDTIREIRRELGIAKELDATGDKGELGKLAEARFKPLSRQQVRRILDQYADRGRGFTDESRAAVTDAEAAKALRTSNMSAGRRTTAATVDRMNTETALGAAGDDAAKKAAAIRAFAIDFASAQASVLSAAGRNLVMTSNVRETRPPATFASAITDILFDNFRVVSSALGGDGGAIVSDARKIAVSELHANISERTFDIFAIPTIVNAIQEDAGQARADDENSYKIDIGI